MTFRLPHLVAFAVVASFIAAPMLGEVTKTKKKKASVESDGSEEKQKSSPTPRASGKAGSKSTSKKSTPRSDDEATPRGGSPTPKGSPSPSPRSKSADSTPKPESTPAPSPKPERAPNATIKTDDLVEYEGLPPRVKALISDSLALTTQNLTYTYGSADPANGGMDCSGTIYYVLRKAGFNDVPRDSSGQYVWTRKAGGFRAVVSRSLDSFEFDELLPGDLLFWTGTYQVERDIPVSHVMLYLGKERATKNPVMFGASDGRTYAGTQRWGVSVFDFKMPRARADDGSGRAGPTFIGYGRIPGLREPTSPGAVVTSTVVSDREEKHSAEALATSTPPTSPAPVRKTTPSKKKSTPKPARKERD